MTPVEPPVERSDPERLLAELWALDEPPERDPGFVIMAMERIERQRLLMGVFALVPATLLVGLLSWALAPVIAVAAQAVHLDGGMIGPLAAAGVTALFLWGWATDRLQPLRA